MGAQRREQNTRTTHARTCTHTHRVGGCEMLRDDFVLRLEVLAVTTPAHGNKQTQTHSTHTQAKKQSKEKRDQIDRQTNQNPTEKHTTKGTNTQTDGRCANQQPKAPAQMLPGVLDGYSGGILGVLEGAPIYHGA